MAEDSTPTTDVFVHHSFRAQARREHPATAPARTFVDSVNEFWVHRSFAVLVKILRKDVAQVMLIQDDDVIQAFAADRADEALDLGILPG